MAEAGVVDEVARPVKGKVSEVCRQFSTSADESLAQRLQDDEHRLKYQWNRETRKVARVDVPLAKTVHNHEEERLQKEQFEFLQQQRRLADEDERIALQLQKEEQLHTAEAKATLTERDAEVALQLQREEERNKELIASHVESDDARIALELQKEEILGKQRNRIKREMEDQALAQKYQEQERQLADMRTMEKELREQRRQLELELLREMQMEDALGHGHQGSNLERSQRSSDNRNTVAILSGGADGYRLSNVEFLSEEDRREILRMQDEELAKALQEQEEKKVRRARREIAVDIEERDYQLARIMQEVEKLELAKRQYLDEGSTYIIYPVPHVESSSFTSSSAPFMRSQSDGTGGHTSSVGGVGSVGGGGSTARTGNVTSSMQYSYVTTSTDRSNGAIANRPPGSGQTTYSAVSQTRTQNSSTSSNDSGRVQSLPLSGVPSSPQNSPPPTTPPPSLPPPSIPPGSMQAPQYASVAQTRVTETRVTSQPPATSPGIREYSHPVLNNQAGSRNSSSIPTHYQNSAGSALPTRRQSSKDKSCKQQ